MDAESSSVQDIDNYPRRESNTDYIFGMFIVIVDILNLAVVYRMLL
jgi:hypothetical protein